MRIEIEIDLGEFNQVYSITVYLLYSSSLFYRELSKQINRNKLYTKSETKAFLNKYSEGLALTEYHLSHLYSIYKKSDSKFVVFKKKEKNESKIPNFQRVRIVEMYTKQSILLADCSCGMYARTGRPCRHILRLVGKNDISMYHVRWYSDYAYYAGEMEFNPELSNKFLNAKKWYSSLNGMCPIINIPLQDIEERISDITCSENLKAYAETVLSVLDSNNVFNVSGESLQEISGNQSKESEIDFFNPSLSTQTKISDSSNVCIEGTNNESASIEYVETQENPEYNEILAECKNLYCLAEGDSECLLHLKKTLNDAKTFIISKRYSQDQRKQNGISNYVSMCPATEKRRSCKRKKSSYEK